MVEKKKSIHIDNKEISPLKSTNLTNTTNA